MKEDSKEFQDASHKTQELVFELVKQVSEMPGNNPASAVTGCMAASALLMMMTRPTGMSLEDARARAVEIISCYCDQYIAFEERDEGALAN